MFDKVYMPSEIITKTGTLWCKRKKPSVNQKISGEKLPSLELHQQCQL